MPYSPRVLFLIKSAPGNTLRREEQESTWLPMLPEGSYYVYCIGTDRIMHRNDHYLYLPIPDGYQNLPMKMKAMVAWAAPFRFYDYFVIMDDDVVVDVQRLYAFLENRPDHFGQRFNGCKEHISGACVGYSRLAFSILADLVPSIPNQGADDWFVSWLVLKPFSRLRVMTDRIHVRSRNHVLTEECFAAEICPFRKGLMDGYLPARA